MKSLNNAKISQTFFLILAINCVQILANQLLTGKANEHVFCISALSCSYFFLLLFRISIFLSFVAESVSGITFSANVSKYDNSSRSLMFEFEESIPTSISCKIIGGNPIPHLKILHGKKDITDSFQFRQHCDVEGPLGLQINKYTSELYSDTFAVNEDWRGTSLKCVAKVPRRHELRRVQSATIEVICT